MKIAYIENPFDHSRLVAGGISKYIINAFRELGAEVLPVELKSKPAIYYLLALKEKIYAKFGKNYRASRSPKLWKKVSRSMQAELATKEHDCIFSFGSLPIAMFESDTPIFFWTDAVFDHLLDYYPEYTGITPASIREGNYLEEKAFKNAKAVFMCTESQVRAAEEEFPDSEIIYAPFGANIDREPSTEEVRTAVSKYNSSKIRLLFIGWDWERKGGDRAVDVVRALTAIGYDAELHAVGPEKRCEIRGDKIVWHGKIDKSVPAENKKFEELLYNSTFLVHFSKAETYGHVLCEAAAFGLPAITSRTGGITEVIRDGVNGRTFADDVPPERIAEYIAEKISSPESYKQFRIQARKEYEERLNWKSAAQTVLNKIKARI